MMSVQTALQQGASMLEEYGVPVPRLTSEVLLAHAMRSDRAHLYAHGTDPLTELAWIHFGRYLNERLQGRPTQYITRKQEFYGRDFFVDDRVLIPRPETEHLVEAALAMIGQQLPAVILDVGTGSGAIAISVALEADCTVFASDISVDAIEVARRNRDQLKARVPLFAADLLESIMPGSIDLLLSNPPYVPGADAANMQREVRDWEPQVALFAGDTGLEIYRRLISAASHAVKPGGRVLMELGYRSLDGVRQMLEAEWTALQVTHDLAGFARVIGATRI